VLQEAACRLVKSAGDDAILDQILSDGVKATRKCKGKKVGINQNKAGDVVTSGKQVCNVYSLAM
jgi:flap endonuclease GEN